MNAPPTPSRCFALIPAAGSGSRMGAARPKQYAPLAGRPLIAHTLAAFLAEPRVEKIFVVIAPDDMLWDTHAAALQDLRIQVLRVGGASRAQSVANGLDAMRSELNDTDWVLVHDAARACLSTTLLAKLIGTVRDHPVGGLLAVPVADTLKCADDRGAVSHTVPRDALWQAQTPQMFRYALLRRALAQTANVTDESRAVEALGLHPLLVESDARNFKVTRPFDLQLAAWVLNDTTGLNNEN